MAKIVKKMGKVKTETPTVEPASRAVSGIGFRKAFSPKELTKIETKRREMRERLFASG